MRDPNDDRTDYERFRDILNEMGVHVAERELGFTELFIAPAAAKPVFIFGRKSGEFHGVIDGGLLSQKGVLFTRQYNGRIIRSDEDEAKDVALSGAVKSDGGCD